MNIILLSFLFLSFVYLILLNSKREFIKGLIYLIYILIYWFLYKYKMISIEYFSITLLFMLFISIQSSLLEIKKINNLLTISYWLFLSLIIYISTIGLSFILILSFVNSPTEIKKEMDTIKYNSIDNKLLDLNLVELEKNIKEELYYTSLNGYLRETNIFDINAFTIHKFNIYILKATSKDFPKIYDYIKKEDKLLKEAYKKGIKTRLSNFKYYFWNYLPYKKVWNLYTRQEDEKTLQINTNKYIYLKDFGFYNPKKDIYAIEVIDKDFKNKIISARTEKEISQEEIKKNYNVILFWKEWRKKIEKNKDWEVFFLYVIKKGEKE